MFAAMRIMPLPSQKTKAGIITPEVERPGAAMQSQAAFLRLGALFMGGRAGGAARLAGAPPVVMTPVSVARPVITELAVHNRNWSTSCSIYSTSH
jgi:hypothetical protein